MSAVLIRYRTRPESAAENRSLVEAVLREAAETSGVRYSAFQEEDGVTFVHLVVRNDGGKLEQLPSFRRFREDLASRVEPGSRTATTLNVLGSAS